MTFSCQFAMRLCYAACAISGDICYRLYVTLWMLCGRNLYDVVLGECFGLGLAVSR